MPITSSDRVIRTNGLLSASIDNDLMILNMQTNNYIALDEIGSRIWDLIEVPLLVSDLCVQLAGEFQAQPNQIEADVLGFLNELQTETLVNVVTG
ncbi:MAG: PqqD family protein [Chloroflexota bacterium]